MAGSAKNIRKIINDPVYGFIHVQPEIIFKLIEHPYFQRLRRITQLGLTHLIYPGANHTRFQHSLGAFHLMQQAIQVLQAKGNTITYEEKTGAEIAILLHDLGHGPYSHTLEGLFFKNVSHEDITLQFMHQLNHEFHRALDTAIAIYTDSYPKKFLHQLVSSQLDVDRLDYLRRDSFFTGVHEGTIGSDRIIEMLNVHHDELVVESKGIYSIEKFLLARRLMYWQVYLHKTALSAEQMLLVILRRAIELAQTSHELSAPANLQVFLNQQPTREQLYDKRGGQHFLENFARLDDAEITIAVKQWMHHPDPILSLLCRKLINRQLFKIRISEQPFSAQTLQQLKHQVGRQYQIPPDQAHYFVFSDMISNNAYSRYNNEINILYKDGTLMDIARASDISNIATLAQTVKKYFLCSPAF